MLAKRLLSPLLKLCALLPLAAHAGRSLEPEDWYRFLSVSDVEVAPDGTAVAYLLTSYERANDEGRDALWITDWAHPAPLALTRGEGVSQPRFTADGQFLSFLSARPADSPTQLWLIDRKGGSPRALSRVSGEISAYALSPDRQHAVLVMRADAEQDACRAPQPHPAAKPPRPLVVDGYYFKLQGQGYLTEDTRTRLFLLDLRSGACAALTDAPHRWDSHPAFSPDGRQVAFVGADFSSAEEVTRESLYVIDARAGAAARRLASLWSPDKQHLEWTHDGRSLVIMLGDEPKYFAYFNDRPALAAVDGGELRLLAPDLDRQVYRARLSGDGRSLLFAVEDDGYQYPASVSLADRALTRLAENVVVLYLAESAGHTAVVASSDQAPPEVYALEGGRLRALTHHNDALFAGITLGAVEDIRFKSADGTEVHGQLVKPSGYVSGRRYPTILWLHGGPDGQDDHSLELSSYGPPLERQFFATHGYLVLAVNYRGSGGRGAAFAQAVLGDWGHREVEDLHAAVDWAVASGIADPERLGVGGWSYGGILTDHLIASDTRFKAAISGGGSANQTALYGTDEDIAQYNAELSPPWQDTARWLKVSYPFFHADRIHTPTLFMAGEEDLIVPVAGSEQMYQALRTLGVPAQLIIYPGETHVPERPSFLVDREQRWLGWMDRYLGAGAK